MDKISFRLCPTKCCASESFFQKVKIVSASSLHQMLCLIIFLSKNKKIFQEIKNLHSVNTVFIFDETFRLIAIF